MRPSLTNRTCVIIPMYIYRGENAPYWEFHLLTRINLLSSGPKGPQWTFYIPQIVPRHLRQIHEHLSCSSSYFRGNRLVTDLINKPPYPFCTSFSIEMGANGTLSPLVRSLNAFSARLMASTFLSGRDDMWLQARKCSTTRFVLGEHHDDRNLYFRKNQCDVEDRNAHHSRSLARFNKSWSTVCSNFDPVRGVSMQSL